MSDLYELYSKRTRYRNLRENVINAINVLSRSSLNDNLSTAVHTLNNNYLVNEVGCKSSTINRAKDCIRTDLSNLNSCLNSINSKINELSREIEKKEMEEG